MKQVLLLFLGLVLSYYPIAQPTALILKLKKGDKYKLTMSSDMNAKQTVFGVELKSQLKVKSTVNFLIKSAKKEEYNVEVSYQTLSLDLQLPETSISFSSETDDKKDVFSSVLKKLIEQSFELIMTNKGEITTINKMQEIFDNAFTEFSDLPESKINQVESQLMKAFGEEAFKANLQTVLTIFPQNPVKNGEEWQVKTSFNNGMSSDIISKYLVTEVTEKDIFIQGTSAIASTEKEKYFELNGRYFKYDLNGKMNAEITLDRKTCWVKKAKVTQEITGDSFLQPNNQVPDGVSIPISIRNQIDISSR